MISVIIPVHNKTADLRETIKSVLAQTYSDFEIIVVDDGSSEDISKAFEGIGDERIRLIKQQKSNASVARNRGVSNSRGDYVAMLDSDDRWLPGHLKECFDMISKIKCDGLYSQPYIQFGESSPKFQKAVKHKEQSMVDYLLYNGYSAQTSTLFFTADSARQVKWDETLHRHQDYDYVIRYSKAFNLVNKDIPSVIYRHCGEIKNIDYYSCIRFINANFNDISPAVYKSYHIQMLHRALKHGADNRIIEHYRKESVRYLSIMSFTEYLSIVNKKGFSTILKHKLKYICAILGCRIKY